MTTAAYEAVHRLRFSRRSALDLGIIIATVCTISLFVKLAWREFTFFGDNAESFLPLWHMYGTALRAGESFFFDPNGWGAGNVVGEAAYGLFNPVTIVNSIFISFTDRISVAGFVVMVEFLALLACGVYLVARSYGANRSASILVGVIAPFAGYTLFYEAGNWASGLMSVVWVVHFWWACRVFSLGRIGPILPFVFGGLAATVGNPYSVVGILVVLFAVGMELLINGGWRRFITLVIIGLLVGTTVVLTYAGLLSALTVIDRSVGGSLVSNENYLTPTLSDMLGLSSPTYLTRIDAWYADHDLVPSAYLSWLLLPLLPWMRWSSMASWRPRLSVLIAALVFLMLTLGPDHLWLFRWPIRFIEYLYLCVLIVFAILLSTGLGRTRLALRTTLSLVSVAIGAYFAFSSQPMQWLSHLAIALLAVVLVLGIRYTVLSHRARHWLLTIAIAGTAVVAPAQAYLFGWSHQPVAPGVDQYPPGDLAVVRDAWSDIDGRVLQIADIGDLVGTDAVASGELVFGNIGRAAGINIMNRYTGINFSAFKDGFGLDYRGSVASYFPISRAWEPVSEEYPVDLVDAFGIDTLVISTARHDLDSIKDRPSHWTLLEESENRVVIARDEPLVGPVLTPSDSVEVSHATESGTDMSFSVKAAAAGYVLLDRLDWPGYRVELDGMSLNTSMTPYGLVRVDIPAGTAGTVTVEYDVPGLKLGAVIAGIGILGALTYQILWWRRMRTRR